jgi:hypothetical protein
VKNICHVGNILTLGGGFFAQPGLGIVKKCNKSGVLRTSAIGYPFALESVQEQIVSKLAEHNPLISKAVSDHFRKPILGEGGFMYLLFGPSMAAVVVIAVIQLRDHFVASR